MIKQGVKLIGLQPQMVHKTTKKKNGQMANGDNKRRTKASNKKVRAKRHNTNGFKGKTARA